jgi:hypothetical protein
MIKLTEAREITPYVWVHPDDGAEPLGASRFNHDTPMAALDWQGRRHFAFRERSREASS